MQRSAFFVIAFALPFVAGCPNKDSGAGSTSADAAPAASSATAVVSGTPSATAKPARPTPVNAADVKRFPDEAKIADVETTLDWDNANVRKAPQGDVVAVLKKGAPVVQVASHAFFYLVTFDDPKKSGQRLMGWVFQDAFKKTAIAAAAPTHGSSCYDNAAGFCDAPELQCPAGQKHFEFEGDYCAKPCTADSDCAPGNCSSEDHALMAHGKPIGRAHHCFYDNGATTPPKASPSASASAAPSAAPSAKADNAESCPKGQKTGPRGQCYKVCAADSDCAKDSKCGGGALFDEAAKICVP